MTWKRGFVFNVKLLSVDIRFLQRKSIGGEWKLLQIIGAQTVYSYNLELIITLRESIFLTEKKK